MIKRRKRNKKEKLAIGTIKTGLVIGAGSVVAPAQAGNLAMVGSFIPAVITVGMGASMIRKINKLRKKKKGGKK